MNRPGADARLAALRMISGVMDQGRHLGEDSPPAGRLDTRDAAFATRLAYGVVRWYASLDWLAARLLDRPLKAGEKEVRRLLLLGIYQLWREDIAAHAAVHATAECARKLRKAWAVGLVNAVLRRFLREREALLAALADSEARHAHPPWLLDRLRADWPRHWSAIVEANNREPPMWLRNNSRRQPRAALLEQLHAAELETHTLQGLPDAVRVRPPVPVTRLPGFAQGSVSVQDAAAQWAAALLAPTPGARVLDACAAPGGKTCHLLERHPDISLTALDRDAARMERVSENLDRLGLQARLLTADATCPDDWWDGRPFDRILLDAPCSSTGVIRRHPEIKWQRDAAAVRQIGGLQQRLLRALWPLLAPGGMLVYATCSVLKRENSEQIQKFMDDTAGAECLGAPGLPGHPEPCGRQILPGEDDQDGFFHALLRKPA